MAGVTYKCPNCGSYIAFNPDHQDWKCDSCGSVYDEKTLLAKAEEYQKQAEADNAQYAQEHSDHDGHNHAAGQTQETAEPAADSASNPPSDSGSGNQVVYHCPSCGSEIMTDETTVATNCYYCHNPMVLQGKLTADMKPDQVLPFSVSKEKAIDQFMQWVSKKRFVPSGFFARDRVKQMEGVYYPHFVTKCELDGRYEGEGLRATVVDAGEYIVTTTEHFAIARQADITFSNVMRPALKSTDRKLSDGIHPFPLDDLKPFSGAYLSGFLAERRDLTAADATADVEEELTGYVSPLLTQTVHYTAYNGSSTANIKNRQSKYVLLPTWVLTYIKGGEKDPYYYVMNGRTGSVCGKLPINKGKLRLYGLGIAVALFAVYCVAAYFLF